MPLTSEQINTVADQAAQHARERAQLAGLQMNELEALQARHRGEVEALRKQMLGGAAPLQVVTGDRAG